MPISLSTVSVLCDLGPPREVGLPKTYRFARRDKPLCVSLPPIANRKLRRAALITTLFADSKQICHLALQALVALANSRTLRRP